MADADECLKGIVFATERPRFRLKYGYMVRLGYWSFIIAKKKLFSIHTTYTGCEKFADE